MYIIRSALSSPLLGLYIHDESGASGQRIGSPKQSRDESQTYLDGVDFSEDFWINREAVSDSRTNVKTIR